MPALFSKKNIRSLLEKNDIKYNQEIYYELIDLVETFTDGILRKVLYSKDLQNINVKGNMLYKAIEKQYFTKFSNPFPFFISKKKIYKLLRKTSEKYQFGLIFSNISLIVFRHACLCLLKNTVEEFKKIREKMGQKSFRHFITGKIRDILDHYKIYSFLRKENAYITSFSENIQKEIIYYTNVMLKNLRKKAKSIKMDPERFSKIYLDEIRRSQLCPYIFIQSELSRNNYGVKTLPQFRTKVRELLNIC